MYKHMSTTDKCSSEGQSPQGNSPPEGTQAGHRGQQGAVQMCCHSRTAGGWVVCPAGQLRGAPWGPGPLRRGPRLGPGHSAVRTGRAGPLRGSWCHSWAAASRVRAHTSHAFYLPVINITKSWFLGAILTIKPNWIASIIDSYLRVESGVPRWLSGKESTCQCRRHGFDPWVGKISWRRKCQPAPVFLPGKPQGQRSLVGYRWWACRDGRNWPHLRGVSRCLMNSREGTEKGSGPETAAYEESFSSWVSSN